MSVYNMLVANHLNQIESGTNFLVFPETKNKDTECYIFPDKAALSLVCMGLGLKKILELCARKVNA